MLSPYQYFTIIQNEIQNQMANLSGYVETPFSLGIEGEEWHSDLPGLVIPTGKLSEKGKNIYIAVVKGSDGYGVVSRDRWEFTESELMAAAIVRVMLEEASDGV